MVARGEVGRMMDKMGGREWEVRFPVIE